MWVVLALCILIALTALVLSVPVDLNARVEVHGRPTAHLRATWLFGRVSKESCTGQGKAEPAAAKPEKKKSGKQLKEKEAGRRKSAAANARFAWDLLNCPGLLRSVERLLGRLLRCVRIRSLGADFRVGLGDPADTAMIVGAMSQVATRLGCLCRARTSASARHRPVSRPPLL